MFTEARKSICSPRTGVADGETTMWILQTELGSSVGARKALKH